VGYERAEVTIDTRTTYYAANFHHKSTKNSISLET